MTDRDDVNKPLDHLSRVRERDDGTDVEQPDYPGTDEPAAASGVSPETAAEPDGANRHGLDKIPPGRA